MSSGLTLGMLPVLETCAAKQNCHIFGNVTVWILRLLCFGELYVVSCYSLIMLLPSRLVMFNLVAWFYSNHKPEKKTYMLILNACMCVCVCFKWWKADFRVSLGLLILDRYVDNFLFIFDYVAWNWWWCFSSGANSTSWSVEPKWNLCLILYSGFLSVLGPKENE